MRQLARKWAGGHANRSGGKRTTLVHNDPAKQFTLTLNADGYGPSDHSSFYAKQIPVLFFWTGTHADYHKPSDTADKINYEDELRILGVVAEIVRMSTARDKRADLHLAKRNRPDVRPDFEYISARYPTTRIVEGRAAARWSARRFAGSQSRFESRRSDRKASPVETCATFTITLTCWAK